MKKIMLFLMMGITPLTISAKSYTSENCNVTLDEKQYEVAIEMSLKNDISQIDCSTLEFIANLKSETIRYKKEALAINLDENFVGPRTTEQFNGIYNMILSGVDNNNRNIVTATVMHPNASSIVSKGKYHFVGITWLPGSAVYNKTNEGYYTKNNSIINYSGSNLKPNIGTNMMNNGHLGEMSAFIMPTGSVTDSMYRFMITYTNTPSSPCMGYYYIKPDVEESITDIHQWYPTTFGTFYWLNRINDTNEYFYSNQVCV